MESISSEKYDYKQSKVYILDLLKILEKKKEEDFQLLSEKMDYLIQASKDLGLSFIYLLLAIKPKNSEKNLGYFLIQLFFDDIEKQKIGKLFNIIFDAFNYIGPKGYLISNPIEEEFLKNIIDLEFVEQISENKPRPEGTLIENLYYKIVSTIDKYNTYIGIDDHLENDIKEIQSQYDECQKEINNLKNNTSIQNIKFNVDFFNDLINIIDFNKLYKKKSNSNEEASSNKINNNEISLCDSLSKSFSESFSKHLEKMPLKQRKFFIINETLSFGEDIETEFKNYHFDNYNSSSKEDKEKMENIIKNTICAMLNNKGGRIYFGINDKKVVKGNKLDYKQRDELGPYLINLASNFYPDCKTSKISVHFIPIKNENQLFMNNLYVIKLIVKQGDTDKLYSLSKSDYISYKRMPGMVGMNCHLTSEVIAKEIHDRITNPKKPIPDEEFDDPKPEENLNESKLKFNQGYKDYDYFGYNYNKNKNFKMKKKPEENLVKIKVKNISEETPYDTLEAIFSEYDDIIVKKRLPKNGEFSAGYGYLFTRTIEDANFLIKELEGYETFDEKMHLFIKK